MDLSKITAVPQPARKGSKLRVWFILYHTTPIGYLEKFRPERGYTHPWKAFAFDGNRVNKPNTMIGVFFDTDHGGNMSAKQAAIAAIIQRHEGGN